MQRRRRILVATSIAIALVTAAGIAQVSAGGDPAPTGQTNDRVLGVSTTLNSPAQALKATYLSRGYAGVGLTQGEWTPIGDSLTINCPGATGKCLVTADLNIQLVTGGVSTNVELCAYVDGSPAGSQVDCTVNVGWAENGAGYKIEHFVHTMVVQHGTHTIQAYAFTGLAGSNAAYFSNVYNVYKRLR